MSTFVPEKGHLWHTLLFLFNQNKKIVESHCLLVESFGEHTSLIRTCVLTIYKRQFQCERQKCEDKELQALLDDDPIQTTLSSTMFNLNHTLIEKRLEWAK